MCESSKMYKSGSRQNFDIILLTVKIKFRQTVKIKFHASFVLCNEYKETTFKEVFIRNDSRLVSFLTGAKPMDRLEHSELDDTFIRLIFSVIFFHFILLTYTK